MRQLALAAASVLFLTTGGALGDTFSDGVVALEHGDHKTAAEIWMALAEGGHPDAQFNLAILYLDGAGVAADPATAAEWFRKAAAQGDPIAAYNLGLLYAEGRGVEQDFTVAAQWYETAVERDHHEAMLRLANLHTNGDGVEKDVGRALSLMQQAQETECLLGDTEDNHKPRHAMMIADQDG